MNIYKFQKPCPKAVMSKSPYDVTCFGVNSTVRFSLIVAYCSLDPNMQI